MRRKPVVLILLFLALLFPCSPMWAQGDPPPVCCNQEDPPPPPPGGDSLGEANAISEFVITDETLKKAGMTRAQFLDGLAAMMFSATDQTYDLLIPIYTQVIASDGTITTQTNLVWIERSQVADEVFNTLDFVLIAHGETWVAVVFESTASD
jgi:hypothetical protein